MEDASSTPEPSAPPAQRRSRAVRALLSLLRIVLLIYICGAVLVYVFQSRLMYHPPGPNTVTPDALGLRYEDLRLTTSDGVSLGGWFVPAASPRGVLLYCHGNGDNLSRTLEWVELYHRMGLSVLTFDYRGYGDSEGQPTEAGTYLDAEAAWNYLVQQRNVPPEQIIVAGKSLGGAVATHLARDHTPRALILESTFTSVPDLAADLLWFFPTRYLARYDYRSIDKLPHVRCPVLVLHSPDDRLIPFSHGQRLYEAAAQPKQFIEMTGGHNAGPEGSGRKYAEGIRDFITNQTGPK